MVANSQNPIILQKQMYKHDDVCDDVQHGGSSLVRKESAEKSRVFMQQPMKLIRMLQ